MHALMPLTSPLAQCAQQQPCARQAVAVPLRSLRFSRVLRAPSARRARPPYGVTVLASRAASPVAEDKQRDGKNRADGGGLDGAGMGTPPTGAAATPASHGTAGVGAPGPDSHFTITVLGASGDLAKKKIYPSLFALFFGGQLPKNFAVYGYARSDMTADKFRETIANSLTCRIDKKAAGENCGKQVEAFLARCFYVSGQYDTLEGYERLNVELMALEAPFAAGHRLYYMSLPPTAFVAGARGAAMAASSRTGYTRMIVEKPFGRDLDSSREMTRSLAQYITEDQTYRIDHYLGKELVENMTVLRFSNLVFEPLWSRQYIQSVQITFSENFGTEGRGGYFDKFGIIRDIMQNHLLQILALFAMEPPVTMAAEDIRNEKVKVLRSMKTLAVEDVVVGQYQGMKYADKGVTYPGYQDDPTVPKGSVCPTFAAAALFIRNARWDGVPFLMKAGKALNSRFCEVRVQFRCVPGQLFSFAGSDGCHNGPSPNELVIRVQPNEAIYLNINNKVPGLGLQLDKSKLDLQYKARYEDLQLPDAYERLILDAINGDKRLFIRNDELDAAWQIFTPLLNELETRRVPPEPYPYGSRGPIGAHYLAAKHGVRWGDPTAE